MAYTLTYVAEITTPALRGTLASTSSIAVIFGVLIQFLCGSFLHWKTVALASSIVPVIATFLLFLVPESPHWLISKSRYLDARKSLAWLRGWTNLEEIEEEFRQLLAHSSSSPNGGFANWRLYLRKSFLWPFGLVTFAFFLGHYSGMATLQTYAVKIFSAFDSPIDKYYATIFLGISEVFGCAISASLVHFLGKRKINFLSLIGSGLSFLIVATYAWYYNVKDLNFNKELSHNWLPTTFLVGSAFFTHFGIRILPWILIGEVYSNETRASGSGLSGSVSYILSFIANKIFLNMINVLTLSGTFWFNAGICWGGLVVLYFILPETEGKALYEIAEHFSGVRKLNNSVHKRKTEAEPIRTMTNNNKDFGNGVANKGFVNDDTIESKL